MSVWQDSIKSLIGDIISRKFVVFICATGLLYLEKISSESWVWIATGYMAANVLENGIVSYFSRGVK